MRSSPILLAAALAGCSDSGILAEYPIPDLTLQVSSPVYGAFEGDAVEVTGTVSPADADLLVEEGLVEINEDGTFFASLPFEKPYRIVDVKATYRDQVETARVPVFQGIDPLVSWPGAITGRLTEKGVDGLGGLLEGLVGGLVTDGLLGGLNTGAPLFEVGGFTFSLVGLTLGDVGVDLDATAAGLAAEIQIKDVVLSSVIRGDLFGNPVELPADLVFPLVTLDAIADVGLDEAEQIVFGLKDVKIDLDVPEIVLGDADLGWLSDLLESFIDVEALIDQALGGQLDQLQEIPLGGPIAFETDLGGTQLALALLEIDTDAQGIAFGLGVGLGGPVPENAGNVPIPTGDFTPRTDLAVALHDGVLQALLSSDLLALLNQNIELPGFLGGFLTPLLANLPGGEQIPENNGWCVAIEPGAARVARFGVGEGPLAGIYLPDAQVTFSTVAVDGSGCQPWLTTSLALEVYLDLDGTAIGLDIAVPEGIVLAYGAEGADTEALVGQLGGVLESLLGLLGGALGGGLDLGDLLGGLGGNTGLPLDGLSIAVGPRRPMIGADGQPIEGMVEMGIDLFGTSPN